MTIKVGWLDILLGKRGSLTGCAIARAFHRAGHHEVAVELHEIRLPGRAFPVPVEAQEFIRAFDYKRPVRPFTFQLSV